MAEENKNLEGQSFRNEALTGSGTITSDGTYADPLPDPTEQRGVSERRTSGGRLLPDLPSDEIANSESVSAKTNEDAPAASSSSTKARSAKS